MKKFEFDSMLNSLRFEINFIFFFRDEQWAACWIDRKFGSNFKFGIVIKIVRIGCAEIKPLSIKTNDIHKEL